MRTYRRKILILLSFILSNGYTFGQTYIGPLIGYDYARIETNSQERDNLFWQTAKSGYVINSPVFGIKLEQYLYKSLYFSWESTITHKYIQVLINGTIDIPVYGIEFNYFQQYFSLKYRILNYLYLGVGVNYNFVNRFSYDSGPNYYPNIHDHDKGINLSCGLKINKFDLELYFYKGYAKLDAFDFKSFQLDPISSYGIKLSYDLKVFDRIKLFDKKVQNCQAF